jgi:hypothetical protein
MPTSSNGSWRRFQSPSKSLPGPETAVPARQEPVQTAGATADRPDGLSLTFGNLTLQIEPRFYTIALMSLPLYALAAFVGNDWSYMLPCTLVAALAIGVVLPLLEVASIACSCRTPQQKASAGEQEIILKAWRLPFFGVLSKLVPSGYLNAQLHLMRRNWRGTRKIPAVVPLPVVLEALAEGMELRLRVPSLTRGIYEADSLEIATCFPFAIAWWSRRIALEKQDSDSYITVLPTLKEISGNFHSRLTPATISAGRTTQAWMLQHRSTALKGLREFTERDSLTQIHWALSTRAGKLLVREFEVESLPDFDIMLNLAEKWNDHQFDLACSAALALVHFGHRLGFTPQLRLHPPLDWDIIAEQLADVPPGLAGVELAAEILARLLPLPYEMARAYQQYKGEQVRTAIDLNADISITHRAVISISPDTKDRGPRSIVLQEISKDYDTTDTEVVPRALATLTHLESEAELSRI